MKESKLLNTRNIYGLKNQFINNLLLIVLKWRLFAVHLIIPKVRDKLADNRMPISCGGLLVLTKQEQKKRARFRVLAIEFFLDINFKNASELFIYIFIKWGDLFCSKFIETVDKTFLICNFTLNPTSPRCFRRGCLVMSCSIKSLIYLCLYSENLNKHWLV